MIIVENKIPAEDYIRLRQNEGWKENIIKKIKK